MAMTKVAEVVVGSGGAASIEFTNIPQTGKDLLCVFSTRASSANVGNIGRVQFNSDTANNYSWVRLWGDGSSVFTSNAATDDDIIRGYDTGANATSNTFSSSTLYASNYTQSNPSLSFDAVSENNATEAYQLITAGRYSSAITSIKLFSNSAANFAQHSTASLYIIS